MRMLTFAPGEAVAPFVRGYTVIEAREETTRTLFPDTGVVLGVRFSGSARQVHEGAVERLPDASLTGMLGAARRICTSAGGGVVLATFREGGAAALFAEPLHEIFGATVGLEGLVARGEIDRVASRLAGAADHRERIAVFEQFLLSRRRTQHGDPLVAAAVRAIRAARGLLRVGDLARELAISRDRLEKRFRHAVGTSPKQLASILRLRRAVELHRSGASLTQVALDAGYFDQSHFIREFRGFTGEAPRRFFTSVEHC